MTNVNIELFKRTSPERKLELIKNLTQAELSGVSKATVLRIVKEAGRRNPGTRNYELYIHPDRRIGNRWNSEVEGLWLNKGKLYVIVYIQLDHTDCEKMIPSDDFFKEGEYRGTSFNHYAFGCVGDFIFRRIGGIQMISPGYRKFRIYPEAAGKLTRCSTSFTTEYGTIRVSWEKRGNTLFCEAEIPHNTTAVFGRKVPDGEKEREYGSGKWKFEIPFGENEIL